MILFSDKSLPICVECDEDGSKAVILEQVHHFTKPGVRIHWRMQSSSFGALRLQIYFPFNRRYTAFAPIDHHRNKLMFYFPWSGHRSMADPWQKQVDVSVFMLWVLW